MAYFGNFGKISPLDPKFAPLRLSWTLGFGRWFLCSLTYELSIFSLWKSQVLPEAKPVTTNLCYTDQNCSPQKCSWRFCQIIQSALWPHWMGLQLLRKIIAKQQLKSLQSPVAAMDLWCDGTPFNWDRTKSFEPLTTTIFSQAMFQALSPLNPVLTWHYKSITILCLT